MGQPVVKGLRLLVKPFNRSNEPEVQRPQRPRRLKLESVQPAPEVLERIEQMVAGVTDPELKECLKRLFVSHSQHTLVNDD